MTQPELNVDLEVLLTRASTLEQIALLDNFPKDPPGRPCLVKQVSEATEHIWKADAEIRWCLADADAQLSDLVDAIRKSAKAYEEYDAAAAESITGGAPAAVVAPAAVGPAVAKGGRRDPGSRDPDWWSGVVDDGTVSVRAELFYISGDSGASMNNYAEHLRRYALFLQDLLPLFRQFLQEEWEGQAADTIWGSFQKWRKSLSALADDCNKLAGYAQKLKDAYDRISTLEVVKQYHYNIPAEISRIQEKHNTDGSNSKEIAKKTSKDFHWFHPQPGTVDWVNRLCRGDFSQMTGWNLGPAAIKQWKRGAPLVYAALQKISDEALTDFLTQAGFTTVGGVPQFPKVGFQWVDTNPGTSAGGPDPDLKLPEPPTTDPGSGLPTMPTMPTLPTLPSDVPSDVPADMSVPTDGVLGGVGAGSSKLPAGGLGMRAAAVGGGGVPSMPLQPPVAAEGAGSAAGRGGPNLGGAGAMGGAAMGGRGGMGMVPPMAGQGGKGEDSKAKRAQQDEEALYAEDRPWTEAVIGNRRRKDGPDNKESK